jgi:two-component sensor histidine kinase
LRVIAASASFCRSFGLSLTKVSGKLLTELGGGEWAIPQLVSMFKATASGLAVVEMYETSICRRGHPGQHLVVNAHRLADDDGGHVRLLVAINDVTLARAEAVERESLIREKEVLLREVQYRVANSLQIIASVLMQSARRVQSDEARGHLRDAHFRVMSIATVQRLLAASTLEDVTIGPYLRQLCDSLAASMISDPARIKIVVTADESKLAANLSVSLGLIVTELVINALKHAFAEDAEGSIKVAFHASRTGWTLAVSDDGVGMPQAPRAPVTGLGTSIIQALAKQLKAEVRITDNSPGTCVRIVQDSEADGTDKALAA